MSKRRYTSKEFKCVDWQALRDRIEGTRVVLAIDVAKEDFVGVLFDGEHGALITFNWVHPEQTSELIERLLWFGQALSLAAVMEPSGTYGDALAWQLRRTGIDLYRVSPKRVHDAAEVYDGVPSLHDAKAAYLIGRLHLQGISQKWQEPSEARREMKARLTQLRLCKERRQAALNRLEAHMSRHWPESLRIVDLHSATLPALISAYGDAAAVSADPQGAEALMRRTGGAGLSAQKIQALLDSAPSSIGVPCLAAERELLQSLASEVVETRGQLRDLERAVQRRVEHTPMLTRMAEAVGQVSAAVLLAANVSANDFAGVQPSIGDSVSRYQGWAEGNPDLFKADRSGSNGAGSDPDIYMDLGGNPDLQF